MILETFCDLKTFQKLTEKIYFTLAVYQALFVVTFMFCLRTLFSGPLLSSAKTAFPSYNFPTPLNCIF